MSKTIEVFGLSGKAGTGKDFISQTYFRPHGYHQYSLSWHFKVGIVGEGLASFVDTFDVKPAPVRELLQQRGTELGRMKYGEDVWLVHAYTWMRVFGDVWGVNKFIIADVRFPNEVDFIKQHGGRVFRIHAPGRAENNSLSDRAKQHISETALDNYTNFDGTINNDPGYENSLDDQISALLSIS